MANPIPAPAVSSKAATKATPVIVQTPDYIKISSDHDHAIEVSIQKNPVYKMVIDTSDERDASIDATVNFLTEKLDNIQSEDIDKREKALTEIGKYVQVMNRQLGSAQAKEMTDKNNTNFQRILKETTEDVALYEDQLDPLCKLADLFTKYGANGNLIEKINLAVKQKKASELEFARSKSLHDELVYALETEIASINAQIQSAQTQIQLNKASIIGIFKGKSNLHLESEIANMKIDLEARQKQLEEMKAKAIEIPEGIHGDEEIIPAEILELQNLGGPQFVAALESLRVDTEHTIAKISSNFDDAVSGLTNTRTTFTTMDRGCTDAIMVLSILNVALQRSIKMVREKAKELIAVDPNAVINPDEGLAQLDKMEKEQRSQDLLAYSEALTTFGTDLSVAIGGLREGQATIKNILQMNALALQSANTHRITGIANTANAVTITIGSIIEVCNRAAGRALADGLNRMRNKAEEGSARLTGGTAEGLALQNEQFKEFAESLATIREQTVRIKEATVESLQKQAKLVSEINEQSTKLADATTESQRAQFEARAGVAPEVKADEPEDEPVANFGFRRKQH